MSFSKPQEKKIEKLLMAGKSFDEVAKTIGGNHHWTDIQFYAWESGAMSWRGSKKMISSRLKKLVSEGKRAERQKLVKEIDERVKYLYNCSKAAKTKLDKIKKAVS